MDIPTQIPSPSKENKRKPFWSRQFSPNITSAQGTFDVIVGAIVPILLLIFDPTVFRAGVFCVGSGPVLGQYAIFAYLAIGLGVVSLLTYLIIRPQNPIGTGIIAGVLMVGTIFAVITGIALAPVSVLGLVVCLGVLGFFPFLTAFVYFRNTVRTVRASITASTTAVWLLGSLLFGILFVLAVPALAQTQVTNIIVHSVEQIAHNPASPDPKAVADLQSLNSLCLHLCTSQIAVAFDHAVSSSEQRQALNALFYDITGEGLSASTCNSSSTNSSSE